VVPPAPEASGEPGSISYLEFVGLFAINYIEEVCGLNIKKPQLIKVEV